MQISSKRSRHSLGQQLQKLSLFSASVLLFLSVASPAFAHHAMGGRMPKTAFEGLMSGIAHPIIGIDHFAFIIAVGLLAAATRRGLLIVFAFIIAALVGTGLHLARLNLLGAELFVSGSILVFGWLLARENVLPTWAVAGLAAIAGIFHGYAYGESIFGVGMPPLFAYLVGFSLTQLVIAVSAWTVGRAFIRQTAETQTLPQPLKTSGLILIGIGLAFLSSELVNLAFPLPHA